MEIHANQNRFATMFSPLKIHLQSTPAASTTLKCPIQHVSLVEDHINPLSMANNRKSEIARNASAQLSAI